MGQIFIRNNQLVEEVFDACYPVLYICGRDKCKSVLKLFIWVRYTFIYVGKFNLAALIGLYLGKYYLVSKRGLKNRPAGFGFAIFRILGNLCLFQT